MAKTFRFSIIIVELFNIVPEQTLRINIFASLRNCLSLNLVGLNQFKNVFNRLKVKEHMNVLSKTSTFIEKYLTNENVFKFHELLHQSTYLKLLIPFRISIFAVIIGVQYYNRYNSLHENKSTTTFQQVPRQQSRFTLQSNYEKRHRFISNYCRSFLFINYINCIQQC